VTYDSGSLLTTVRVDVNGDSVADMAILLNGDHTGDLTLLG